MKALYMSPILDIQRRVHEIGRIRLGAARKDTTRPGRPLETFRFTSNRRDLLEHVSAAHGGNITTFGDNQYDVVTEADTLDVLIPPEDVSFSQWWEQWTGGGCVRRCDGHREVLNDTACVCMVENERRCDAVTRLSVLLPDFQTFGVWRVETHSWYAAGELKSAIELALGMADMRGEHLAYGTLRIEARAVKRAGQPPKRFNVLVLDVKMGGPLGNVTAVTVPRELPQAAMDASAALTVVGLPEPAPKTPRGDIGPSPERLDDETVVAVPVLPMPLDERPFEEPEPLPEVNLLPARPVGRPPQEPSRQKDMRRMFAALKDVAVPDEDHDLLRACLAVLETAKRREPVASWKDLHDDELTYVEQRVQDLRRGRMTATKRPDGTGFVFALKNGRQADVYQHPEDGWTFEVSV